jgi:Zn-dependent protease
MRLHVRFLPLLGIIAWACFKEAGPTGANWPLTLVCLIFTCDELNELGHSVVSQQLGVQVKSVTLLQVGGAAFLCSIP